jgi:hypothetical protein
MCWLSSASRCAGPNKRCCANVLLCRIGCALRLPHHQRVNLTGRPNVWGGRSGEAFAERVRDAADAVNG